MRCILVLCLLACFSVLVEAQSSEPAPPDAVVEAGHCVATADGDWFGLSPDNPYELDLGYASGAGFGRDSLYLIEFTTPTHSRGYAFVFQTHGKGSHRELTLEFRIQFQQTEDGTQRVSLIDPPLGGVGTQEETITAVRQVGFHSWRVPVAELRERGKSAACSTAGALR